MGWHSTAWLLGPSKALKQTYQDRTQTLLSSRCSCGLHIQEQQQTPSTCNSMSLSLAVGKLSSRRELQRLLQMQSAAGHRWEFEQTCWTADIIALEHFDAATGHRGEHL